jgi:hypothetical protein
MEKIIIETSSKRKAEISLQELLENLKKDKVIYEIHEDDVALGGEDDYLMLGFSFVLSSTLSGITWDYIKSIIIMAIQKLPKKSKANINANIVITGPKKEISYNLIIESQKDNIVIELPGNLKVNIY